MLSPRAPLLPERRPRPLVSLTPLIDVVFILLVFFMLASSFLDWRAIPIGPRVQGGSTSTPSDSVRLTVAVNGELSLDGESLAREAVTARLRDRLAENPALGVVLQSAPGTPLQHTVTALDLVAASGITGVSVWVPTGPQQ